MTRLRTSRLLLALGVLSFAPAAFGQAALGEAADDEGFEPLFNGKDLSGWTRVNTAPSTWMVKEGMLVCSGKPIGELRTTRMYQNFVLELEWRHLQPKGNAGVFVWADALTARGTPFHRSVEVQVLENAYGNTKSHTTHGDIFPIHGATMTPVNGRGGKRAFPTEFRSKPSPQWNHYRIECRDGDVSLAVNGKVVTRGRDCSPRKGYICLESEGGVVHYRNVRIKELPDTPIEAKHVARPARGYRTLYTGVDLSGWSTSQGNAGHWQAKDWVLVYDGASKAEDVSLVTEESFGDAGFLFDVRLKKESGVPRFVVRDDADAAIAIDPADERLADAFDEGRWNRFEGTVRGEVLTLSVNGTEVLRRRVEGLAAKGPFRIVPEGAVDFANLFVRELGGAADSERDR